MPATSMT